MHPVNDRTLGIYRHGHYCRRASSRRGAVVRVVAQVLLAVLVAIGVYLPLLLIVYVDLHARGVLP